MFKKVPLGGHEPPLPMAGRTGLNYNGKKTRPIWFFDLVVKILIAVRV